MLYERKINEKEDPDSIRLVDPVSESGSGSRRAKVTHKKKIKKFHDLKC
jgi:hypothetical protein